VLHLVRDVAKAVAAVCCLPAGTLAPLFTLLMLSMTQGPSWRSGWCLSTPLTRPSSWQLVCLSRCVCVVDSGCQRMWQCVEQEGKMTGRAA
jgi:hypothetical protein